MSRRFIGSFLASVIVAGTLLVAGSAAAEAAPQFKTAMARHSGKCLDVIGVSTDDGARLIQFRCNGGPNQQFLVLPIGGGRHLVVARHSGQCLDVESASRANGARIVQEPCTGVPDQQWFARNVGGGYVTLIALHSGRCLDVSGASQADLAPVIQWNCNGGRNQQWRIS